MKEIGLYKDDVGLKSIQKRTNYGRYRGGGWEVGQTPLLITQ